MTTEELKRAMYLNLPQARTVYGAEAFENALEAYLEALRQETTAKDVLIDHLERMGDVMRDGYMYQQQLTMQARAEADQYRNKLQAFEFANKSAGEFLVEARNKVRAQRQSIGQLKNERDNATYALKVKDSKFNKALQELSELRKVLGSASAQSSAANVSELKLDAKSTHSECRHLFASPDFCSSCSACGESL